MKNFQQKRGLSNFLQSKAFLVFLGALILVFVWSLISFTVKMRETAKNKRIAEEKMAELEKVKSQLTSDIDKLNTNEGIEESIRQKFGLAKEGEGLIVIVDDKNLPANSIDSKNGFFSFLKNLFK